MYHPGKLVFRVMGTSQIVPEFVVCVWTMIMNEYKRVFHQGSVRKSIWIDGDWLLWMAYDVWNRFSRLGIPYFDNATQKRIYFDETALLQRKKKLFINNTVKSNIDFKEKMTETQKNLMNHRINRKTFLL